MLFIWISVWFPVCMLWFMCSFGETFICVSYANKNLESWTLNINTEWIRTPHSNSPTILLQHGIPRYADACANTPTILLPHKNIEGHTAHTIVSWYNPKQWIIVHTSDLMMKIRQIAYSLNHHTREMGKLKTHSPIYCIMEHINTEYIHLQQHSYKPT